MQIQQVLDAWALSHELNQVTESEVTVDELVEAERMLGRMLPVDAHTLYAAHDGGFFVGGNLHLWPLLPASSQDLAVGNGADQLRQWEWLIPDEVIPFAGNGSDATYSLWLPATGNAKPLVVEIGEPGDEPALAIVGDDLASFLAGHSAYHLLLFASDGFDTKPALDALGVPEELRSIDFGDDDYDRLLSWANLNLPDKTPDVYDNPWTAEQVAEFAALPD